MRFINLFLVIAFCSMLVFAQEASPMFYQSLAWSPDGKYLTFTGMRDINMKDKPMKADIFVMRADGSDLKKITGDESNEFYSSWGKGRIAFGVTKPGTRETEIYLANPDGSNLTAITKAGAGRNATPDISRDGKRIAFISTRDGEKMQIYTMNADGSNVTRLTKDDTVGYYNPTWSPDGRRIVYYSEKGDQKDQVWVMNADGSNQTLLTAGVGHNIFPAFSQDGKRIIFSSSRREENPTGTYVDGSFVYVINVDGSNLTKLANIPSFYARLSPDGKRIAYIAGKFPENAIYIANADGSGAVRVTK